MNLREMLAHPLAITMWDFSWLERRWSGAGYEDWDQCLDELQVRGYDAVRIDAFPHLIAADPGREWELLPLWDQHLWGSPGLNRIRVQPYLNQFIEKCAERGLWVALSSWFRQDRADIRMKIRTPDDLGRVWIAALDSIGEAGLLNHILYVDLCNEFPLGAPFVPSGLLRASAEGRRWTGNAIAVVRQAHPQLQYCFSVTAEYDTWREQDVTPFDLLEPHLWMAQCGDFYEQVGYHYEAFAPGGYQNLVQHGERIYRAQPAVWQRQLQEGIDRLAEWSRTARRPLITTEGWAVVDYKDFPLLSWDWVKELCAFGTRQASLSGQWIALATSNFCGPQFVGMWRDVAWHRALTDLIHEAPMRPEAASSTKL